MNLWIEETHVAEERNCLIAEPYAYETSYSPDERGQLFKILQREYGRCTSKMYVDTADGKTSTVGWVFSKQRGYEDAPEEKYTHTVWVALLKEAPYTVKHYDYHEVA